MIKNINGRDRGITLHYSFFKTLFIFRGGRTEKDRERNAEVRDQSPLVHAPTGDQTQNPGMCPDQEWNQQPLALQDNTQPPQTTVEGQHFRI